MGRWERETPGGTPEEAGRGPADLEDVEVDPSLPAGERVRRYLAQVGDPYRFRAGGTMVELTFAEDGRALEKALAAYLRARSGV